MKCIKLIWEQISGDVSSILNQSRFLIRGSVHPFVWKVSGSGVLKHFFGSGKNLGRTDPKCRYIMMIAFCIWAHQNRYSSILHITCEKRKPELV
jgi:hypothetical protein